MSVIEGGETKKGPAAKTVMAAVPLLAPGREAVKVKLPGDEALNVVDTPAAAVKDPPPLTFQLTGWAEITALNWSRTVAVNSWLAPVVTPDVTGETEIVVGTCPTLTVVLRVAD